MRIKSILHGDISTFKNKRYKLAILSCTALLGLGSASFLSAEIKESSASDSTLLNEDQGIILAGRLTAAYGPSPHPFKQGQRRDHKGVDIAAPIGTPIFAPGEGVILSATDVYQNKPKYGKVVVIETKNGAQTLFAHLDSFNVAAGQQVKAGQHIATIGNTGVSTGPHVHMETFIKGKRVNPLDVWRLAE